MARGGQHLNESYHWCQGKTSLDSNASYKGHVDKWVVEQDTRGYMDMWTTLGKCHKPREPGLCKFFRAWVIFLTEHTVLNSI